MSTRNNTKLLVWRWPVLLGVISAAGLVTALLGDAWYDLISCAALGLVAITCVWLGAAQRT